MKSVWRFVKGIVLKGESSDLVENIEGSVWHNSTDNELKAYLNAAVRTIVSEDQAQTLTNKTIDADNNTISNLAHGAEVDNPTSGVHGVSGNVVGTSDTQTLTNKTLTDSTTTIQDEGDNTKKAQFQASGITTGTTRTLTIPDADTTIVGDDATQTLTNKTIDANNNTVSNLEHGAEVDNPSSGVHGVSGNVVGTSDTQSLTNKTLGDTNTINAQDDAFTVDDAVDGTKQIDFDAGGTTGTKTTIAAAQTANRTVTMPDATDTLVGKATTDTLTNKTIDGDNNTISNLAHGAEVDNPSSGVHGVTGNVVGTTDTQDLSNKTFTDAITMQEQGSTPSTPASGDQKIYMKTDGKFYKLDDAGIELEVGSGAGGGGINYIDNPDAETDTTGWATYADAAAATPVDGTGGSPTVTWTRNTTNPGRDTADFKFTKDAANRQGEGASYDFSIDNVDAGKELDFTVDFKTEASNYVTGDVRVYFYDVTNATLITPVLVNQSDPELEATNGNWRQLTWRMWTNSTSTSYRMIIHTASTSATAYTLNFDNFRVGPKTFFNTPIVGEWEEFPMTIEGATSNPTKASSPTDDKAFWRRVGDQMEITYYYQHTSNTGAAAGSGDYFFNLPSGYTMDTNKVGVSSNRGVLGHGYVFSTTNGNDIVEVLYRDVDSVVLINGSGSLVSSSTHDLVESTVRYMFKFSVPIAEWDNSSAQMSTTQANDQTIRVIYGITSGTANSSFTHATSEVIDYDNQIEDTHNAVTTGASWLFTAPRAATYKVSANMTWANTTNMNRTIMLVRKNGSEFGRITDEESVARLTVSGTSILVPLEAGDTLDVQGLQSDSTTASRSLNTSSNLSQISIISEPDFTIFGTYHDPVIASYSISSSTANSSFADNATEIVDYDNKEVDTHNAVTTGASWTFTAPRSGSYKIGASIEWANSTNLDHSFLDVYKNGALYGRLDANFTSGHITVSGTPIVLSLNVGDTINIRALQDDTTSAARSIGTTSNRYFVSIHSL